MLHFHLVKPTFVMEVAERTKIYTWMVERYNDTFSLSTYFFSERKNALKIHKLYWLLLFKLDIFVIEISWHKSLEMTCGELKIFVSWKPKEQKWIFRINLHYSSIKKSKLIESNLSTFKASNTFGPWALPEEYRILTKIYNFFKNSTNNFFAEKLIEKII